MTPATTTIKATAPSANPACERRYAPKEYARSGPLTWLSAAGGVGTGEVGAGPCGKSAGEPGAAAGEPGAGQAGGLGTCVAAAFPRIDALIGPRSLGRGGW